MTTILGISAYFHDSAAALIVDGDIVAAAQEERFSRIKHDNSFPKKAIEFCLSSAGINPNQIDYIGFYEKPFLKFERLLETYISYAPIGFKSFLSMLPSWLKEKLYIPNGINKFLRNSYNKRYIFCEHHESHAASAFFPSPFEESAILTMDGVGEWTTSSYGIGKGNKIDITHEQKFPHSLGLLYSAFTYFCGFKVNDGEYKLMGLAPYGTPNKVDLILDNLLDLKKDGSFRLDMSYFNYCQGLTMTSGKFNDLFQRPPRKQGEKISKEIVDIAASIQKVTENIIVMSINHIHKETGMNNLCLAGGVALNCVANGRILREGPFENLWVQPAAGDAGGALGVALHIWYQLLENVRVLNAPDSQHGSFLGPEYKNYEIKSFLDQQGVEYIFINDIKELCDEVSNEISNGKVVGWFQGRMEFGPRALGSRSILGDPRNREMQNIINRKIKYRDSFLPFAPAILEEKIPDYFYMKNNQNSPYMLLVTLVKDEKLVNHFEESNHDSDENVITKLQKNKSVIPAVTHVDCSARIQSVNFNDNELFYKLITSFYKKTGCPILINTSFNLGWEPIVCSPLDAYKTFMSSDLDMLAIGNFLIDKSKQKSSVEVLDYSNNFLEKMLICPACKSGLKKNNRELKCMNCSNKFRFQSNIPELFWVDQDVNHSHDITNCVKDFYEKTPFPNYDEHDSLRSLIEKSRQGVYARKLDESIPYNSTILEVGCGTGQLTNFLGISCRVVVGTDISLNSLKLAEDFRALHNLNRVRFVQMNLFEPVFHPGTFDVVICNGVLHHTHDPYNGLIKIVSLAKPGGYIIIGLYNSYGRIFTDIRRKIFKLTNARIKWLDPVIRRKELIGAKCDAWYADQYMHPHESKHTFGQVLEWFDKSSVEFIRSIPGLKLENDGLEGESLFESQQVGDSLDRLIVQAHMLLSDNKSEGGFFIFIGKKRII